MLKKVNAFISERAEYLKALENNPAYVKKHLSEFQDIEDPFDHKR